MRGGLISSVVLHAAILGWALVTIQTQPPLTMSEPEPLAVDLVTTADVTKLRKGVRTAKQLEAEAKPTPQPEVAKKEAPKPTPVAAAPPPPPPEPPPPPPPPEAKPEPKPEPEKVAALPEPPPPPVPSPEEQKRLEELVKEQERQADEQHLKQRQEEEKKQREEEEKKKREAEEKKKREEEEKKKREEEKKKREAELRKKREAEAKKKEFDANKIAALLNKAPDKAPPPTAADPESTSRNRGPALGAPEGHDRQISASEIAVLVQIIRACVQQKWILSAGGEEAMNTSIRLHLQFTPDGRLSAAPQILNPQNTAYFLAASEGAIRAAQACEPYSLPPEKYSYWREVNINFTLRDMMR